MGNAPEHPAALNNRVTYSSSASVNNSSDDEEREEVPATFDASLTSEHSVSFSCTLNDSLMFKEFILVVFETL